MHYPDRHHPIFMLQDALQALGATAEFNHRDERTLGCWGLIVNGKSMVWLIDNRWQHEREREDPAAKVLLERGVLVCHAQKPDMERVGGKWLPLAASPEYHKTDSAKLFDVAMVGYIRDSQRADALTDVASRFTLSHASGIFGERASQTYCEARAGLNVVTRFGDPNAWDSWNMRSPEIMATGIPLVTEYQPYLSDLGLIDRINYVAYHTRFEILIAIEYALEHPEIGEVGLQLVNERHCYRHRAETVLQWMNEVKG